MSDRGRRGLFPQWWVSFIFSCLVPRGGRWGMTTLCTACYTVSNIRTVTGQRKLTCCLTLWAWARSAAFRNFPCLLTSLGVLAVCDKECHRPLSPCPQLLCLITILAETVWYTHHKLNKIVCLHCLNYGLISHHLLTYSLCLCGDPVAVQAATCPPCLHSVILLILVTWTMLPPPNYVIFYLKIS